MPFSLPFSVNAVRIMSTTTITTTTTKPPPSSSSSSSSTKPRRPRLLGGTKRSAIHPMVTTSQKPLVHKAAAIKSAKVKARSVFRQTKQVRFSSEIKTYYPTRQQQQQQQFDAAAAAQESTWYNGQEILQFKAAARQVHKMILTQYKAALLVDDQNNAGTSVTFSDTCWSHTLSRVYKAYCESPPIAPHVLLAVLKASSSRTNLDHNVDDDNDDNDDNDDDNVVVVGMEQKSVPVVALDTAMRRKQLYAAIHQLQQQQQQQQQQQAFNDTDAVITTTRTIKMANLSRSLTLPSKLYARHIAHMLHEQNNNHAAATTTGRS